MNVTKNSKVRSKVRSTDTTIQQPAHMPSGNTTALRKYRRAFWVSQYFQKSCFPTMAYCIFCDMSQFTPPPPHPHPLSGAQIRSITVTSLIVLHTTLPVHQQHPSVCLADPLIDASVIPFVQVLDKATAGAVMRLLMCGVHPHDSQSPFTATLGGLSLCVRAGDPYAGAMVVPGVCKQTSQPSTVTTALATRFSTVGLRAGAQTTTLDSSTGAWEQSRPTLAPPLSKQ